MSAWLVMPQPGQMRPPVLGNGEPQPMTMDAARRNAQVVEADDERSAAEAWSCSVRDLMVGTALLVVRLPAEGRTFFREYADKGPPGADAFALAMGDPVTIDRGMGALS